MQKIAPAEVRYIKLGGKGAWTPLCVERGELRLGFRDVPHELCAAGDWEAVRQIFLGQGRTKSAASRFMGELRDFYEAGSDCLWVTFHDDRLWWNFAEPGVEAIEPAEPYFGTKIRKTISGWRSTDIRGEVLRQRTLGSRLTRVASFQGTICSVPDVPYLLRRINAEESEVLAAASTTRAALIGIAGRMITDLDQDDFETLTDLIFARGGWSRVSSLGGNMKTVDLVLKQATTGEQAAVQVKSRADTAAYQDSVARMIAEGHDHVFFVCHSPTGIFSVPERTEVGSPKVHVWTGEHLASAALNAGLFDWLVERSG